MITRQAVCLISFLILAGISACSAPDPAVTPTPSPIPSPTMVAATALPTVARPTPQPTVLACLTMPGRVQLDVVATTVPPQEFVIYLPPCYEYETDARYPVLYLLHGQTYTQDQWPRLGAPAVADALILSGEVPPYIIVFPDDHYWNSAAGGGFGYRLTNDLIPYVDAHYRTRAERKYRALGGLSRGGGWAAKVGFDHPDLFGMLGFHSPALFKDNAPFLDAIIKNIPDDMRPLVWIDIGDNDQELGNAILFQDMLTQNDYIHEFHRFSGDHTENYWGAHVKQYLRWYGKNWLPEELAGQ